VKLEWLRDHAVGAQIECAFDDSEVPYAVIGIKTLLGVVGELPLSA
jgi:hypothetical protein